MTEEGQSKNRPLLLIKTAKWKTRLRSGFLFAGAQRHNHFVGDD